MSSVVEVLTKARALVARGHCKDNAALDADGEYVHAGDPRARFWCAVGAIWAAGPDEPDEAVRRATRDVLRAVLGTCTLVAWNDAPERTQAEVVDAFDRAIAAEVARVSE
jgi:hypothetical protein